MGQWDDVTPNAFEEVWDGTSGADVESIVNLVTTWSLMITFNFWRYFKLAHVQAADSATASGNDIDEGAYADWGIK